jgi:tetratricopeptide (TPR) repeat protein
LPSDAHYHAHMGEKKRRLSAAATRPENARAVIGQAVELLRAGDPDRARILCEPLLEAPPTDAEALHYLGYLAIELGQPERAVAILRRAIELQPGVAFFHNTLSIAFQRLGQARSAEEALRRTIELAPELHEPFNNLGNVLLSQARYAEAAACYRRAARLAPQLGAYRSAFAEALAHASGAPAAELRQDLLEALAHEEVDPKSLARSILALLRAAPALGELCRLAESGKLDTDVPARHWAALEDPLLLRLLESTIAGDAALEQLLTRVRRLLLESEVDGRPLPLSLEFIAALARQCFACEYAWSITAEEEQSFAALEQKLMTPAASATPEGQRGLAVLAAYRPLHALPWAGGLQATTTPAMQSLLRQQVFEPAEEARLAHEIPALHPVEDSVSRAVQAQYEDNPYPRWVRLGRFDHDKQFAAVLKELFPRKSFAPQPPGPLSVLIAGCGTGSHSVRCALRFTDAAILAVDLSRASLAHALRKTRELGLSNVEYAQADLLRLGQLERAFRLIECVGVLHHLRDPVAGWRELLQLLVPDGFMRVGLYSELGRANIVHGQAFAQHGGYDGSTESIRRLRQDLIEAARNDEKLAKLLLIRDFYSMSGCRDLLLHVQEQRFTLPRIAGVLDELGLAFLGFELPGPHVALEYLARFPDDPAMDDLSRWHAFEQQHPETFSGMYQFWVCRKRA